MDDVDYSATSVRPQWSELPEPVRVAISDALGAEVVDAGRSAGSGFTRGFAAPLILAGDRQVFVKAASDQFRFAYHGYQREAVVVPSLPAAIRVPRIVTTAHAEADGERWFAIATEFVAGRMPGNPWTAEDFTIATSTCEAMADALTPSPLAGLDQLTEALLADDALPGLFVSMRDGDQPVPQGFQPWLPDRLGELADLVDRYPVALAGNSATHGDLRPDNMLVDRSGTLWTVDWNWLSLAPVWADWVSLLPAARWHGIDTDALLARSPLTAGAAADDVDCFAAMVAAYMLARFGRPIPPGGPMPAVRRHQRLTAWLFLDWLAARRNW